MYLLKTLISYNFIAEKHEGLLNGSYGSVVLTGNAYKYIKHKHILTNISIDKNLKEKLSIP